MPSLLPITSRSSVCSESSSRPPYPSLPAVSGPCSNVQSPSARVGGGTNCPRSVVPRRPRGHRPGRHEPRRRSLASPAAWRRHLAAQTEGDEPLKLVPGDEESATRSSAGEASRLDFALFGPPSNRVGRASCEFGHFFDRVPLFCLAGQHLANVANPVQDLCPHR